MLKRSELEKWYDQKETMYDISESGIAYVPNGFGDCFKIENFTSELATYYPTKGCDFLIKEICDLHSCNEENVSITSGASEALFILMNLFLQPEDEVIVVSPFYYDTNGIIEEKGCIVKHIKMDENNSFSLSLDSVSDLVTSKTKLLIFSRIHNPSGVIVKKAVVDELCILAKSKNFYIICDEVCTNISLNNDVGLCIDTSRGSNLIHINSLSKAYGCAGIRLGWIIADTGVINMAVAVKEHLSVFTSSLSQYVGARILHHSGLFLKRINALVKDNFKQLLAFENQNRTRIRLIKPEGGCCCIANYFSKTPSYDFCLELFGRYNVLTTPGDVFGYPHSFRLGFGIDSDIFIESLKRLHLFLSDSTTEGS